MVRPPFPVRLVRLALAAGLAALFIVATAPPAGAHPAPFTFLDVRVTNSALELSLVAHVFDVAHDTGLQTPEQLFDEGVLATRGAQFAALLPARIQFVVDGTAIATGAWTVAEPLPERQSIRLTATAALTAAPGIIGLNAFLFPYDTAHQTFVNFHDGDAIASQTILDASRRETRFYAGTIRGGTAAARWSVVRGARQVFGGVGHLAIAVGLLLLPITPRQAWRLVMAFIAGQLATTVLGGYAIVLPPLRLLEPALALAVVYAGADNLMASGGRDVRPWMAAAMGTIEGFSVAAQLRTIGLSRLAMGWSTVATQIGVGLSLCLLVWAIRSTFDIVRRNGASVASRLTLVGSLLVIAAGAVWFVELVFFPSAPLPAFMARL